MWLQHPLDMWPKFKTNQEVIYKGERHTIESLACMAGGYWYFMYNVAGAVAESEITKFIN